MLKTIRNTKSTTKFKEIKAGVGGNNVIDNSEITNQISSIERKNQAKTTKSKILI